MNRIFLALILVFLASPSKADFFKDGVLTAGELSDFCSSTNPSSVGLCIGFIKGVESWDAEFIVHAGKKASFCEPSNENVKDEMLIFKKYMDDHPEKRPYEASLEFIGSLSKAYPCK